jgi:hypothetical protein
MKSPILRFAPLAVACAAALAPLSSHAIDGITDRVGDLLPTFAGNAGMTDLDVVSASVFYDALTDQFRLVSTMSGPIGLTAQALYVWGVNRGAGVASFAPNGIDGVRFDRTVQVRPDGTGTVAGTPLPAGSVSITGNTITAVVSGALLPNNGFANKLDYTWNLWPRNTAFAGFAAISDFAPDNANFTSTPGTVAAIPEPGTVAMMLAGLGVMGAVARRRRRG